MKITVHRKNDSRESFSSLPFSELVEHPWWQIPCSGIEPTQRPASQPSLRWFSNRIKERSPDHYSGGASLPLPPGKVISFGRILRKRGVRSKRAKKGMLYYVAKEKLDV